MRDGDSKEDRNADGRQPQRGDEEKTDIDRRAEKEA